jgi:maleylacetate reductase
VTRRFRHVESERTIVFGPGAIGAAEDVLAEGYTLLTTERAARSAPGVAARAAGVIHVGPGLVEQVAAQLRAAGVRASDLVALGGGRVIDVAKALAAADHVGVSAIPTSLSGAEMTGVHRHATGVGEQTPRVRPHVVINDPALSASQPADHLAASSANALGHAVTGLISDRATPLGRAVARDAVIQIVTGWSGWAPDRPALALGALLAGWAVDVSGLGPHHVLAQTAVRTASLGHAEANAALLPASIAALRARRPTDFEALDGSLGLTLESFAQALRDRAGAAGLGRMGADRALLDRAVEAAAGRVELRRVAPPFDDTELRSIYLAAAIDRSMRA